ncbi:hypothetical protein GCM10008083_27340 [Ulvibacter litoralis]|nr:hypothetical protein GCM10008083_27340 [Ulvibacter litoralis]
MVTVNSFAQIDLNKFSEFKGFEYSKTYTTLSNVIQNNNFTNKEYDGIITKPLLFEKTGMQGDVANESIWAVGYDFHTNNHGGMNIPNASITDANGNTYITGGSSNETIAEGNFITIKVNSQGDIVWETRQPGTTYAVEFGLDIVQDHEGNPISTGVFWNGNDMDIQTIKYDASTGDILWENTYDGGTLSLDVPTTITTDVNGNTYVAGITYDENLVTYLTIKYDANGNLLWAVKDDNTVTQSWNEPTAIAVDETGSVIVTGYGNDANYHVGYYTLKYSSSGEKQWGQLYNYVNNSNENTDSLARDVAVDTFGNIYITGTFDTFWENMGTIKYNANGSQEWLKDYKYNTDFTNGYNIEVVNDTTIYVGGNHYGDYMDDGIVLISYQANGTENWTKYTDDYLNNNGSFLTLDSNNLPVIGSLGFDNFYEEKQVKFYKFNSDGSILQENSFTEQYSEYGGIVNFMGLGLDVADNLYFTFYSFDTFLGGIFQFAKLPFSIPNTLEWSEVFSNEGGSSSIMLNTIEEGNNIYTTSEVFGTVIDDVYYSTKSLIKYNDEGDVVWTKEFNGNIDDLGTDFGIDIKIDSSGNVIVYLIPSIYNFQQTPSRLIKYDAEGNLIWQVDKLYNAPNMFAFFLDDFDNIYISGSSFENISDTNPKFTTSKFSRDEGNELWTKYLNSSNANDNLFTINDGTINAQGDILLIGALGVSSFFSQTTDLVLLSYSEDGTLIDFKTFNINQNNTAGYGILLDENENVYINGAQQDQSTYSEQLLLVKFNSDLQHEWTVTHSEANRRVRSYKMYQNSLGNIIVSGFSVNLENNKVVLGNYDSEGNEIWIYNTEINNFYVDFYIDDEDTVYLLNQVASTTLPYRLNYSTAPLILGKLYKIDALGIVIENQYFTGPELSKFYPTTLTPLQNGTLLVGGTLNHELSFYEGLYFFESSHIVLGVEDNEAINPSQNWLGQNYPNPVKNNTTTLPFFLKYGGHTKIVLYDIMGREIYTLLDTEVSSGLNHITVDTSNLKGFYIYKLKCGNYSNSKKMIIE